MKCDIQPLAQTKQAKRPISGHQQEKTDACNGIAVLVVLTVGIFLLIPKLPDYDPFFAKNLFLPADEFIFSQWAGRMKLIF